MAAAGQAAYEGLPKDAFIVETKELPDGAHPNRALVLWMLHPEKHDRGPLSEENPYACPEATQGSYFLGPTRISLADTSAGRLLNTVKLDSRGSDKFAVPYRIRPEGAYLSYYHVPPPLTHGEGKPELLDLRDYDGDGEALEVAFFSAETCMVLGTTLIGYSKRQDMVMQYWVELTHGGKREFCKWVDYLFAKSPQHPGYWKYEIDYRGRSGYLDQYEIRYDPALERFYGTLKSVPP